MKLATFLSADGAEPLAGEVRGDEILAFGPGDTVLDRLASGDRTQARGEAFPLADVTLLAPVPRPRAIFGIGLNYRAHAEEQGGRAPEQPVVFMKLPASAAPPNAPVRCPAVVKRLDYEGELAVVIGPARPDGAVAGYAVANDLSARDLQKREGQWTRAKGADGFCPFGPWVTTVDEVPEPGNLFLRTWVNGELRQDGRTNDLLFSTDQVANHIPAAGDPGPGNRTLPDKQGGGGAAFEP